MTGARGLPPPFPGYLERRCQKQTPVSAFSDRSKGKDKSRKEEVGRQSVTAFRTWQADTLLHVGTSLSLPSPPHTLGETGFFPADPFPCSGEGVLLELGARAGMEYVLYT